ncbi:heme-dependent oxidative N-demethylase family protein [Primorskyibacter sp. 2E107]|uniref:heme-dependent oxidative N-demethylase family protein n=1 Tax=Primorskyibacter sp. 2E107 TaxID=3403458 RepID=UPI003AF8D0EC
MPASLASPILNQTLPYDPLRPRPLPGVAPVGPEGWLMANDAYTAQLLEKARLLRERRSEVLWLDPAYMEPAREMLAEVLLQLPEGFIDTDDGVVCPDGRRVVPDAADPLGSIGALIQEDLCLLVKEGSEHVLRGALLCFPASWTLAQKAGKPLLGIHTPVASYDADLGRRVQRLFDGIRPGRPLWRFNALWYDDPALFQPRREDDPRHGKTSAAPPFLRSERQGLYRLPQSGAVVFSIHTFVLPRATVTDQFGS